MIYLDVVFLILLFAWHVMYVGLCMVFPIFTSIFWSHVMVYISLLGISAYFFLLICFPSPQVP